MANIITAIGALADIIIANKEKLTEIDAESVTLIMEAIWQEALKPCGPSWQLPALTTLALC